MIRPAPAWCLLTVLAMGCSTTTETIAPVPSTVSVDAIADAGLDAEQARRARWAGVLPELPAAPVAFTAVVGTARAPVFEAPSTTSRQLGTLKQGGEIEVERALLWRASDRKDSPVMPAGRPGHAPTWAQFRIGERTMFVPWTCLVAPEVFQARPPADVMAGAEMDLLEVSSGVLDSERHGIWAGLVEATPDREAIDARIELTESRFRPSAEASAPLPTVFATPTPADRFFFGREQVARVLASVPCIGPDAAVSARMQEIGDAVAAVGGLARPYAGWIWIVLDAPGTTDCLGLPGGFVLATSGLMEAIAGDDELAALLAREVARVEMDVAMDAVGASLAARADAVREGSHDSGDATGDANRWADVEGVVAMIDSGTSPLAALFDRSCEATERALGTRAVMLASAAGFDPWGLVNLLVRMNESGASIPGVETTPGATLKVASITADLVARHGADVAVAEPVAAASTIEDAASTELAPEDAPRD